MRIFFDNPLICPVGFLMSGQSQQVAVRLNIPGDMFEYTVDFDIKLRWKEVAKPRDEWS